MTFDAAACRGSLSHGRQVEVVDPDNVKLIGTISDSPGVHGIAIASDFRDGFIGNGSENKVSI